ncbi:hypothetical protein H4582DRAFT_1819021, partial [Lactarius indigo]
LVPQSLVDYLKTNRMNIVPLWSGTLRQQRTIYQEGDTNMLIESYHHVLKSHWLDGKRNWRADHLVHTLVVDMLPQYEIRALRQRKQFEGADLAKKRHMDIFAQAPEMSANSIQCLGNKCFYV